MSFKPRLTAPEVSNMNFIHSSRGGKNSCIMINSTTGSVMPNCVGYAWGRFMEILGDYPKLSRGDAENWWGYTQDGYQRGSTPKVGAVICWRAGSTHTGTDGVGHVGIVEAINSDGSIVTSESSYGGNFFTVRTRNNSNGNWGASSNVFQGFIYNPNATSSSPYAQALLDFLSIATSKVGQDGEWSWQVSGLSRGQPWCAAFVAACARKAGVLDKLIVNTYGAGSHAREGVKRKMGVWLKGPHQGGNPIPRPGDLILYRWEPAYGVDTYYSDHVGIVRGVTDTTVKTVEGNVGSDSNWTSTVGLREYKLSYSCISGYYRPNWGDIDYSQLEGWSGLGQSLYSTVNTEYDAIVRRIGYLDSEYQPSINPSPLPLSVINYTSALGALFNSIRRPATGVDANLGTLESKQRITIEYLMGQGLNCAAAVGIAANIQHESGFDTASVGDSGTSFGICQWHASRGSAMKSMVGPTWASNLTGQLDFLWYEMNSSFRGLLSSLRGLPNSEYGARSSADLFVRDFERPRDVEGASKRRQATASEFWAKISQQLHI